MDYYSILGVSQGASEQEIHKAYRKKAKEYHPDRNPGDAKAAELYRQVDEAYSVLSDPVKKAAYDRPAYRPTNTNFGRKRPSGFNFTSGPNFNFNEVFEEFFGGEKATRGRNIQARIEIDLQEVLLGCTKEISYKRRYRCGKCSGNGVTSVTSCPVCLGSGFGQTQEPPFMVQSLCASCEGRGYIKSVKCDECIGSGFSAMQERTFKVTIPPGIENGMQVRIAGEGEDSQKVVGRTGDLVIFVFVREHKIFRREGSDLLVDIPVSYTQLALGSKVEIPTLAEGKVEVNVPPGSQSNTKFRLKGRGLPDKRGSLGDILATLKVETPKSPDGEYKELLNKLSEFESKFVTPRREAWAKKMQDYNN